MSCPVPKDPSAIDASLHLLAQQVLDALTAGDLEPCLLHVACQSDGLSLGTKDLEGNHPTTLLVGFVAPSEWYALGVAAAGHAYDMADRTRDRSRSKRVHTVTLLSRSGEIISRTVVHGDPELSRILDAGADQLVGEQVDLLRLALELPTPPPPCGAEVFWAVEWMSGLVRLDRAPTTWDEVAAVAASFEWTASWTRLRDQAIDGRLVIPELDARDVPWLDDGAFARFLLTRCPPLSAVRQQVAEILPDPLARRLDRVLDDLGIPRTAWPEDCAA